MGGDHNTGSRIFWAGQRVVTTSKPGERRIGRIAIPEARDFPATTDVVISGVIINNASYFGLVGGRGVAAYCASKGALVLLTKALALDHAPQNIRVTASARAAWTRPCSGGRWRSWAAKRPCAPASRPSILWVASARQRRWPKQPSTWPPTIRPLSPERRSL
ncbi:MAG TPA: SDR family NAD(P)-dependent oxidoreductase [Anaerolineae bacterium]|nr:SDR family NAD(P)-dependent oxidoreductase [Anaerolineae bacterium]